MSDRARVALAALLLAVLAFAPGPALARGAYIMTVSGSEFYVEALDCASVMNGLAKFMELVNPVYVYQGVSCSGSWVAAGDARTVVLGTWGTWNGHGASNYTFTVVFSEVNPSMFELPLSSALLIAAAAFGVLAVGFVFRVAIASLKEDGA